MTSTLTVDFSSDAAYLKLSDAAIVETCEVTSTVLVDLDEFDVVVGVEVLTLDAYIPRGELITKFHMRVEDLKVLDRIRPSVTSFVQRQACPLSPSGTNDFVAV